MLTSASIENDIGDRSARSLSRFFTRAALLPSQPSGRHGAVLLASLHLNQCGLTCRGAVPLLEALGHLPNLTFLSLADNILTSTSTTDALARFISRSASLTSLDVSCVGLRLTETLTASLQNTQVLHSLHLASNRIGDSGGEEMIKVLRRNRSIAELNVSANLLHSNFLQQLILVYDSTATSSTSGDHQISCSISHQELCRERIGGRSALQHIDVRDNLFGDLTEKAVLIGRLRQVVPTVLVDMHPLKGSALCDGVQEV